MPLTFWLWLAFLVIALPGVILLAWDWDIDDEGDPRLPVKPPVFYEDGGSLKQERRSVPRIEHKEHSPVRFAFMDEVLGEDE